MQNKSTLLTVALAIVCAFSLALAFISFQNFRKMELEFNEKKAKLVKENLDLKDRTDTIQATLTKKSDTLDVYEKENEALAAQLSQIRTQYRKILETYASQINILKKKRMALKKRISSLEHIPLIDYIRKSVTAQEDPTARKVLEDTLTKMELIRDGKPVNLEPIVVVKKEEAPAPAAQEVPQAVETKASSAEETEEAPPPAPKPARRPGKRGFVLSLDKQNSLVVVNLGRRDDLKEGDRMTILKGDQEIAEAEVMSVRYRIAAAFVDDIRYGHTVNEIKENDRVIVTE